MNFSVFSLTDDEMTTTTRDSIIAFLEDEAEFGYDDDLKTWIGLLDGVIVFVCQVHETDDQVSIFSVCTATKMRRQGIMTKVLTRIFEGDTRRFWIAAEVTKPEYVPMYQKLGFVKPERVRSVPYYGYVGRDLVQLIRH